MTCRLKIFSAVPNKNSADKRNRLAPYCAKFSDDRKVEDATIHEDEKADDQERQGVEALPMSRVQ